MEPPSYGRKAAAGAALLKAALCPTTPGNRPVDWHLGPNELQWFNLLVDELWPYSEAAVRDLLKKEVEARIPTLEFTKFSFGRSTPKLSKIDGVHHRTQAGGVELFAQLDWTGTPDISLKVGVGPLTTFTAGISQLSLSGQLVVSMRPFLPILPIIGTIGIHFLSSPDLHITFTGAGEKFPVKMVQDAIENVLMELMVVPHRILIDCAGVNGVRREQIPVSYAMLNSPPPMSVLQVCIVQARNLPAADSSGTSDPYVEIKLGAQSLRTRTIPKTLNPQWGDCDFFNFLVWDNTQVLHIRVYDEDTLSLDDYLGRVTNKTVVEVFESCKGEEGAWFALEGKTAGAQIRLKANWFAIRNTNIPRHVLSNAPVSCKKRHALKNLQPRDIAPGTECDICGQAIASIAQHFMGQVKGLVFGGEPSNVGAACAACDFRVCRKCVSEKQNPVGVLRVSLHTAKLPIRGAAAGESGDKLKVTVMASGVGEVTKTTKPAVGHEAKDLSMDAAVRNLADVAGLNVGMIARCLALPEKEVAERLARRRSEMSSFDLAWDDVVDFFVTTPLSKIKLKVELVPFVSLIGSGVKGTAEIDAGQVLLKSRDQQSWRGLLHLSNGVDITISLGLMALWPDQWEWKTGQMCLYTSSRTGQKFLTKITQVNPGDGSVMLELKPNEWMTREVQASLLSHYWVRGDACLYMSASQGKTFPTRIIDVDLQNGNVMIELKEGEWISYAVQATILSRFWEVGDDCIFWDKTKNLQVRTKIASVDASSASVAVELYPNYLIPINGQVEVLSR